MVDTSKIQLIFEQLIESDPASRETLLESLCAGDTDLAQEVRSLLDAFVDAGSYLDSPLGSKNLSLPPMSGVGDQVGDYKLIEQIGEGGFGKVFLADQHPFFRRQVAVKILKPGLATAEVLSRFSAEQQALAMMSHPSIARVFDAGSTENGNPYFVMEYVQGVPISEYCDKHCLPTDKRIELVMEVCKAIQHAHQKGVIHRDIKPANVLVSGEGGKPVPKVIDFGIAKAVDQQLGEYSVHTVASRMMGTPQFMSPEQASQSGDVDTRSDVFSLGALLYELLTGSSPIQIAQLKGLGFDEMRQLIQECNLSRPSRRLSEHSNSLAAISKTRGVGPAALTKTIAGDLDWITMKALEKDRERRYQSPLELAAELRRFQNDEAINARPPSRSYRFRKFVSKHRAACAFAATLATVLVAATTYSMYQTSLAKKRLVQSRALTDYMISTFDSFNPSASTGTEMTAVEFLDTAVENFDESSRQAELAVDDQVRFLDAIGEAYLLLGDYKKSLRVSERAIAFESSAEFDMTSKMKRQLLYAKALLGTGDREAASQIFENRS